MLQCRAFKHGALETRSNIPETSAPTAAEEWAFPANISDRFAIPKN
jgi:hypothetical protein